jgi:lipopolysaccharide assembly outer membrane protein LptD (OstA)
MRVSISRVAIVAMVGLTGSVAAQGNAPRQQSVTYGPSSSPTQITADTLTYNEAQRTTYARGHVRVVSEVSTTTADEADVHLLNFSPVSRLGVDLRGNVRVVIAPGDGRAR